ncbi:unnamed protein product, partial [Strongylus vulgaris]
AFSDFPKPGPLLESKEQFKEETAPAPKRDTKDRLFSTVAKEIEDLEEPPEQTSGGTPAFTKEEEPDVRKILRQILGQLQLFLCWREFRGERQVLPILSQQLSAKSRLVGVA